MLAFYPSATKYQPNSQRRLEEKHQLVTYLMNDKAVFRKAPATPHCLSNNSCRPILEGAILSCRRFYFRDNKFGAQNSARFQEFRLSQRRKALVNIGIQMSDPFQLLFRLKPFNGFSLLKASYGAQTPEFWQKVHLREGIIAF